MVYKKEAMLKRIEKLCEYRHDLKEMECLSFDEYIKDKKTKYFMERLLFLIAEDILDSLDHVLSSKFETISDSYEDIIDNAYKNSIIDHSMYSNLRGIGGFRNVLAHGYMQISDADVFKNFQKMMAVIDSIIENLEDIVRYA